MKKFIIPAVILFVIVLGILYTQIDRKPLKNISVADIEEIYIIDPAERSLTIKKEADINLVLTTLQKMHFKWEMTKNVDGFGLIIKIKPRKDATIEILLRENDIVIDHKSYRIQKKYSNEIRKIFEKIYKS